MEQPIYTAAQLVLDEQLSRFCLEHRRIGPQAAGFLPMEEEQLQPETEEVGVTN